MRFVIYLTALALCAACNGGSPQATQRSVTEKTCTPYVVDDKGTVTEEEVFVPRGFDSAAEVVPIVKEASCK